MDILVSPLDTRKTRYNRYPGQKIIMGMNANGKSTGPI